MHINTNIKGLIMELEHDNYQDVLDSRDIIERLDELRGMEKLDDNEKAELEALDKLESECQGCGDWDHGETLIHSSYFEEYARELVNDCGYIPDDLPWWITDAIDWEKIADNVKLDYCEVDYAGQTFFIRS